MKELKTDIACFNFAGTHTITINSDEIAREAFRERDADLADRPQLSIVESIGDNYKTMGTSSYGEHFMKMKKSDHNGNYVR
jgi:hypothetical protein